MGNNNKVSTIPLCVCVCVSYEDCAVVAAETQGRKGAVATVRLRGKNEGRMLLRGCLWMRLTAQS